jgi:hypothetical protein
LFWLCHHCVCAAVAFFRTSKSHYCKIPHSDREFTEIFSPADAQKLQSEGEFRFSKQENFDTESMIFGDGVNFIRPFTCLLDAHVFADVTIFSRNAPMCSPVTLGCNFKGNEGSSITGDQKPLNGLSAAHDEYGRHAMAGRPDPVGDNSPSKSTKG